MPLPQTLFSAASTLVLPCWLALLLTPFVPAIRPWVWRITGLAVPALLAVAYLVLIRQAVGATPGGGFGSIVQVRALFANDAALTAGWLHYLAFDLFVGTWIARTGTRERVHPALALPCLPLTFVAGPLGLLLFLGLRLLPKRHAAA